MSGCAEVEAEGVFGDEGSLLSGLSLTADISETELRLECCDSGRLRASIRGRVVLLGPEKLVRGDMLPLDRGRASSLVSELER